MTSNSKNHTISAIVAKSILRLFFVIATLLLVFYFSKDATALEQGFVVFENKWVIVFPVLLFLIFIVLLTVMLKNKYNQIEINWLFSLSGIFLFIYLILLFSRIYPLL